MKHLYNLSSFKIFISFSCLFLGLTATSSSQFNVDLPVPIQGNYIPSDTIFMAVDGDDNNNGSFNSPVATFNKALQLIPFGTEGVNSGINYGLIQLKPGTYFTSNGFSQPISQWKQGNTYKNVSVEGLGEVTIQGESDDLASSHLLFLKGDYIFIKNLNFKYSEIIGILFNRSNEYPRQNNITIDDVRIDSVLSFSILAVGVDSILIKNTASFYAARGNFEDITLCQYPSGIKFLGCKNATIHDSEIAYTRGEGLNFQNTEYGLAYNNIIHDNPSNIYNENSANIIYRNNYIYNNPALEKEYWLHCPEESTTVKVAGAGISLANEGSCIYGGPNGTYNFCGTSCAFNYSYRNCDSIYAYNNILQNIGVAFNFWEGVLNNLGGKNCIRNVFISNNTITNVLWDDSNHNGAIVNFAYSRLLLGDTYGYTRNINITNNIFALPSSDLYPNLRPIRIGSNSQIPNHVEVSFDNNLWSRLPNPLMNNDLVRENIPYDFQIFSNDKEALRPCSGVADYKHLAASASYINNDFTYLNRNVALTNVGALETSDGDCTITSVQNNSTSNLDFSIWPNPIQDNLFIATNLSDNFSIEIINLNGAILKSYNSPKTLLDVSSLEQGVYFIKVKHQNSFGTRKFIKL